MISFKAVGVCDAEIMKKTPENKWEPFSSNFVQLDYDHNDFGTLKQNAQDWLKYCDRSKGEKTFVNDILRDISVTRDRDCSYYAMTCQKDSFEKLDPDKVLGYIQMKNKNIIEHEIEYLQANPATHYYAKNRQYKNIGEMLIKSIVKLFPNKDIIADPVKEALDFYLKLGFERMEGSRKLILRV